MSTTVTYKTIAGGAVKEVSPDPTADAGLALNTNFRAIADSIQTLESDGISIVTSAAGTLATGDSLTVTHAAGGLRRHQGMFRDGKRRYGWDEPDPRDDTATLLPPGWPARAAPLAQATKRGAA